VSIGDGCVIGAGAVVAKSVPAYHVAAGVPAHLLRKVANNVPDAPSLIYETKDDRVIVCEPEQTPSHAANEAEHSGFAKSSDKFQLAQ
jgi:tetrahydrodipicolinate N-succinyltransferase